MAYKSVFALLVHLPGGQLGQKQNLPQILLGGFFDEKFFGGHFGIDGRGNDYGRMQL